MIALEKASVVLVFNRNRILVKTDKGWTFYTPTLLDTGKVIEELMAEDGLAENLQSFYDSLEQIGITITNVFKSNPEGTALLIEKLCEKALKEARRERGDDFNKYRRYMDYLNEFSEHLRETRITIPVERYRIKIVRILQKGINEICQAIPENNHHQLQT